jgi:hypothetical protein
MLLGELPRELGDLRPWLRGLPTVGKRELSFLHELPAVAAARELVAPLLEHGLTPITLFDATEAVFLLAELVWEEGLWPAGTPLVLGPAQAVGQEQARVVPHQLWAHEIEKMTDCSQRAALRLVDWLTPVAVVRPFLFPQTHSRWCDGRVELTPATDESRGLTLTERWSKQADLDPAARQAFSSLIRVPHHGQTRNR